MKKKRFAAGEVLAALQEPASQPLLVLLQAMHDQDDQQSATALGTEPFRERRTFDCANL